MTGVRGSAGQVAEPADGDAEAVGRDRAAGAVAGVEIAVVGDLLDGCERSEAGAGVLPDVDRPGVDAGVVVARRAGHGDRAARPGCGGDRPADLVAAVGCAGRELDGQCPERAVPCRCEHAARVDDTTRRADDQAVAVDERDARPERVVAGGAGRRDRRAEPRPLAGRLALEHPDAPCFGLVAEPVRLADGEAVTEQVERVAEVRQWFELWRAHEALEHPGRALAGALEDRHDTRPGCRLVVERRADREPIAVDIDDEAELIADRVGGAEDLGLDGRRVAGVAPHEGAAAVDVVGRTAR